MHKPHMVQGLLSAAQVKNKPGARARTFAGRPCLEGRKDGGQHGYTQAATRQHTQTHTAEKGTYGPDGRTTHLVS